jgi:phosphatidylcholine synthase
MVAVYLYALPFGKWTSLAIVITLALLTFVPSKYLYPSLPGKFNRFVSILGIPWAIAMVWIIFKLPDSLGSGPVLDPTTLKVAWASLSYPILYLAASWVITIMHWTRREPAAGEGVAE